MSFFHSSLYRDPATLFAAFKNGDETAYKHFFYLYHQSLYWIIIGIVDEEEAKDVVAAAFEKLSNDRARINDADHLWRYLFIVARNGAIDHLRKQETRRRARKELGQLEETVYTEPKESEIVHARLMEKISLLIQKFPPRRRKIFLLHYFIDMDTRSIAKQLAINEQTVRNQLNRAIIALRKALQ